LVAADLEELTLEALVRLLEEGQQYSPSDPIKAHSQLFTRALDFEEVEEYVH